MPRLPPSNNLPRKRVAAHIRRFSANAGLQFSSQVLPLIAGAAAIPIVYRHLTHADFGVFTIGLSMLGLFALLDLGLGRATVRFMARSFAVDDTVGAASVVSHSAVLLGGFSCAACIVLLLAIPILQGHWFQSSAASQATLRGSLYILAAALPVIGLTAVFRAVLESREKFLVISIIQALLGVCTYLVPLLLSFMTTDVRLLITGAVACRGLAFIGFVFAAVSVWPGTFPWHDARARSQKEFRRFSFWLVVSNVVGSGIVYGDRAILVRMFGLSEVAFYNIPLEMLGRLMIIVNSAVTVVFPALSRASGSDIQFEKMYVPLIAWLGATTGLLFLALSMLAPLGLRLWLGDDFQAHSTILVQVFLVGLAFQTLNVFAMAILNARGIARPITIMHLLETPVYFAALYFFGTHFGLIGVACVWSARVFVEYICFVGFQVSFGEKSEARCRVQGGVIAASNVVPLMLIALVKNAPVVIVASGACAAISFLWGLSVLRSKA